MFEQRAVAFLDILGFSEFLRQAETTPQKKNEFDVLKHLIDSHIRWNNEHLAPTVPDAVKPKYIFISDSIVLSAPLSEQGFDGLVVVSQTCIDLSHKLLEKGFLLKGGISVGSVWQEPGNIFGSAYIEAYLLHEKARGPTIELTTRAIDHLKGASHRNAPLTILELWITQPDGRVTLDALYPSYIRGVTQYARTEHAFKQYRAWIHVRLDELTRFGSAWEKWEMMRNLFNDALARHHINVPKL